ncbi:MAG: AsmA family protein [Thermodesulfobacteriota bacterium]
MGKYAKIIGGTVAVLLLLIAGLAAAIRFYLTDERIRSLVVPAAEKALQRKVGLGAISVGLFTGISLTDFAVREADGQSDFVKAEALILRYDFWPLLKKQVVIREIRLDRPFVRIHRDKSGAFNFDSLPFVAARKEPPAAANASPGQMTIIVDEVTIREARLAVSDETGAIPALETMLNADLSLAANPAGMPTISQGNADLAATITIGKIKPRIILKAAFDTNRITYQAEALLDQESVRFEGAVQDYRTTPQATVNLAAKSLDIEKLLALKASLPQKEEKTAASSPIVKYNVKGTVKIDRLRHPRLPLTGLVADFDPRQLSFKANADVKGDMVALSGMVADYLTAPQATLNLNAQRLSVENLMALAATPQETGKGSPPPAVAKPLAQKLPKKFTAQGRITVEELLYKKLALTGLAVPYRLQNGVLTVSNLTARMAGGAVVSNDTVDLNKLDPGLKGDLAVRGVQVSEFLKGVAPAAASLVGGSAEGACTFAGSGLGWAKLQHSLVADASFSVQGAQLRNAPLTAAVALLLNMPELSDLSLTNAAGTVRVAKRVVTLDTSLTGQDLGVQAAGTIDFDKNLNLPVTMRFSPRLSSKLQQQASIARYLTSDAGETMIRLKIGGTLGKPRPEPDPAMLREGAERAIKKKLLEKLDKKLGSQGEQPADPNQPPQPASPAQQLLRGILGM